MEFKLVNELCLEHPSIENTINWELLFTIEYYNSLLHSNIANAVLVEIKILNYSHHIDIVRW